MPDKTDHELRQLKANLCLLVKRWVDEANDIRSDTEPNDKTKDMNDAVAHTNEQHAAALAMLLK